MKSALWLPLIILITACSAFDRTDVVGTLNADTVIYETQIAQIELDRQINETSVVQTVIAAETEVASQGGINQQLLQTITVGSTPTISIIRSNAPQTTGQQAQSSQPNATQAPFDASQQRFVVTGTSTDTNSVDGCVVNPTTTFGTDEDRIYMTAQAFNLAQGTLMSVEWMREGTMVWQDTWNVDSDYSDICIWFYLLPSYVPFTAGSWSAQLYANSAPIGQSVQFLLEDM